MSGHSSWTVDTLHEHLVALAAESDRRHEQRFIGQERALALAVAGVNERLGGMNEFRAALSDQAATFVTRAELKTMQTTIEALTSRLDRQEGSSKGMTAAWGILLGAVGLLGAIITIALAFLAR